MADFNINIGPYYMESINQFVENLNMPFSNTNFYESPEIFPANLAVPENFPSFGTVFNQLNQNLAMEVTHQPPISTTRTEIGSRKRKSMEVSEACSSVDVTPQVSESGVPIRSNSSRRGKRAKSGNEEEEKPKEVVHVRARRGQATDSHSLAERVRRGKINERLNCLRDIVPGCYKTMGMAMMLDEIINYVRSLQNQVEFLSMKLTAASRFHDLNADTNAIQAMQKPKIEEAKELEAVIRGGYGRVASYQSTWSL